MNINHEQEICKSCGFCCDGTLFNRASSYKTETLLPEMETEEFNDTYWFKLPCPYFNKCCTVYEQKRPKICSEFRCNLLEDFSKGKIDMTESIKLIKLIRAQQKRIVNLLPERDQTKSLSELYSTFLENNKEQMNSKKFCLTHSKLLLEWASYEKKLTKFHDPNKASNDKSGSK